MRDKIFKGLWVLYILFYINATHAEIYQWTDEEGNIKFSDKKDKTIQQETIQLKPINQVTQEDTHTNEEVKKVIEDAELVKQKQQKEKQKQAQLQHEQQLSLRQQQEMCFDAYKNLTVLQYQRPVFILNGQLNPQGMYIPANSDPHYLSDDERDDEIQKYKAIATSSCKEDQHTHTQNAAIVHWNLQKHCSTNKEILDRTPKKSDQFPGKAFLKQQTQTKEACQKEISIDFDSGSYQYID